MSFLFRFLKYKLRTIGVFVFFGAMLLASAALYHLPLAAILYPLGLCALFGAVFLGAEYLRSRKKHREIARLRLAVSEMAEALPTAESTEGEDYRETLLALAGDTVKKNAAEELRYQDMVEYYTLWAHQIKTPIASMKLTLESEDTPLSRKLSRELFRIEQYVEMVLTFLRLDSSSGDYLFKEYDVDEIVRGAVRKYAPDFIAKKLRLTYEELDMRLLTDEKWLGFIIEQVIGNACKYTREGGVRIYAASPTAIAIEDTGIGIAAEDLPRIFEKGFTGRNGRLEKTSSGIGLYLCRRAAEKLGAKISVTSAVGKGTTILIDLGEKERIKE